MANAIIFIDLTPEKLETVFWYSVLQYSYCIVGGLVFWGKRNHLDAAFKYRNITLVYSLSQGSYWFDCFLVLGFLLIKSMLKKRKFGRTQLSQHDYPISLRG